MGKQTLDTQIRGCSKKDELIELYLTINVLENRAPDFETPVRTNWTIFVGDQFKYKLPNAVDPDQNDAPEVRIVPLSNHTFPPFVKFLSEINVI